MVGHHAPDLSRLFLYVIMGRRLCLTTLVSNHRLLPVASAMKSATRSRPFLNDGTIINFYKDTVMIAPWHFY